jgi:hypothetical protein
MLKGKIQEPPLKKGGELGFFTLNLAISRTCYRTSYWSCYRLCYWTSYRTGHPHHSASDGCVFIRPKHRKSIPKSRWSPPAASCPSLKLSGASNFNPRRSGIRYSLFCQPCGLKCSHCLSDVDRKLPYWLDVAARQLRAGYRTNFSAEGALSFLHFSLLIPCLRSSIYTIGQFSLTP